MKTKGRMHLLFAAALAGTGLLWLCAMATTPLAAAPEAVRSGSLAGLALGIACAALGYASLLWAGRERPDVRRANQRVVGTYVAGVLFRLVVIFGTALALRRWAGLDAAAVLLTAVASYVPLSFVEVALLARVWISDEKSLGSIGGESADG